MLFIAKSMITTSSAKTAKLELSAKDSNVTPKCREIKITASLEARDIGRASGLGNLCLGVSDQSKPATHDHLKTGQRG